MAQPAVDLNQLRGLVLRNQANDANLPLPQSEKVLVDREGAIRLGSQTSPAENRRLSEVHQGTFSSNTRFERDHGIAVYKLPRNARPVTVSNIPGHLYTICSELRDRYEMFLYHDGNLYQVLVRFPNVAGRYGVHDAHLFSDGRICFGPAGGMSSFEQAFSKSVLWASGFSIFTRTGRFPFSKNNV